eukprot:scaffold116356_cov122-Cyclotella_meneghiniana.AAC.4
MMWIARRVHHYQTVQLSSTNLMLRDLRAAPINGMADNGQNRFGMDSYAGFLDVLYGRALECELPLLPTSRSK